MITFNKQPGQRILEIGCGDNPNPNSDVCVDVRQTAATHFVVDLEKTAWPIGSDEFDAVLAHFLLEHISYPHIPITLAEVFRVLKPGGRFIAATPNTEAQVKWITDPANSEGWDGKDFFTSASENLFGTQYAGQDNGPHVHKSYFSPAIAFDLFRAAGFESVTISPYGERQTDMVIEAKKPEAVDDTVVLPMPAAPTVLREEQSPVGAGPAAVPEVFQQAKPIEVAVAPVLSTQDPRGAVEMPKTELPPTEAVQKAPGDAGSVFDRTYFTKGKMNGGYGGGGFRDFACHWTTVSYILSRRPESVLEVGSSYGHLIKRLQDAGIRSHGLDVSEHCFLMRCCDGLIKWDATKIPWPIGDKEFDLCLSLACLDCLPTESLPDVLRECARTCKRGLFGVGFAKPHFPNHDGTRLTHKPKEWWENLFRGNGLDENWQVVDKDSLEHGSLPPEVSAGDGKVKLNLGSSTSMFYHGWTNIDSNADLAQFAQPNGYKFIHRDVREGLPFKTGEVDAIFAGHVLPHLNYREGLSVLRDCRRVLKPSGVMRLSVTGASRLNAMYERSRNEEEYGLNQFDEMDENCANQTTAAGKLWALLYQGRQSIYDWETLHAQLVDAKFVPSLSAFRQTDLASFIQLMSETSESWQGGTPIFANAVPLVG